ncbi:uncharacterized protein LOC110092048 [Dendrobium catenatum]|uniref:uncharacterized protein LOC110092048 n=1 Tax=Dendrobium catenatum TaxID=906689 RepID=UPI0009F38E2C|nr:uncharacterized protein LOC110092048 [Dendrobium catenatum]
MSKDAGQGASSSAWCTTLPNKGEARVHDTNASAEFELECGVRALVYRLGQQEFLLDTLHQHPLRLDLLDNLKKVNLSIADTSASLVSWVIQRAKVKWLQHGEEDLNFLYGKIRCRQGKSKSLTNLFSCNPTLSRDDVINYIVQYFQTLSNPSPIAPGKYVLPVGDSLSDNLANLLISPFLEGEIKTAVMKGSSKLASGPDGFNYHFYKTGWHIIGPLLCKEINAFFSKGYLPSGIKATALVIIPKSSNATTISDYSPISLCNTLYKIIAKVIAARLKPLMPIIVKDTQAGFVKSRISTDSILLAKEILSLVSKKGAHNIFCAKIDIKKAFDSVSREFLLARLHHKGFPNEFINRIKACISNINFSVVIDGALEGYFTSSAGLRQGCSLSPYLFCIVMDALSNLLEERGFKGFKAENFHLSHLLYADDVLIFGEATVANCTLLSNILSEFGDASGLKAAQISFIWFLGTMMYNSSSLLASWFSSRYLSPWKPPPPLASKFWVSICNTALLVKHNCSFNVSSSAPIALHWDPWNTLSKVPIATEPITCIIWKDKSKVKFKDFMEEFYIGSQDSPWENLVWHKNYSLKHSVYVWLALVGGLKTHDALRLRNIVVPELCSLCNNHPESVNHLFFECDYSFSVLEALIPASSGFLFRPTVLQFLQWLDSEYLGTSLYKNCFKLVVCCTLYYVWRERNSRRFGNDFHSINTLIASIKRVINIKLGKWKNRDLLLGHI